MDRAVPSWTACGSPGRIGRARGQASAKQEAEEKEKNSTAQKRAEGVWISKRAWRATRTPLRPRLCLFGVCYRGLPIVRLPLQRSSAAWRPISTRPHTGEIGKRGSQGATGATHLAKKEVSSMHASQHTMRWCDVQSFT